jgi:hypothetical protein
MANEPSRRRDEEPQRYAGFRIGSDGPSQADLDKLRSLAHPIRAYKQWVRRRRLGIYAGDDEP